MRRTSVLGDRENLKQRIRPGIYSDDLSTGAGFTVVDNPDTVAIFGYDYSADGVPSAPNGTGTTGLKLEANIANGTAAETAAVHSLGFSNTPYRVSFDAWVNLSIADGASAEYLGGGVGHDGTTPGRSGASLIVTGDGGSSRDYRLYKDAGEQFLRTEFTDHLCCISKTRCSCRTESNRVQ